MVHSVFSNFLNNLKLFQNFTESLRMYPPVPLMIRKANVDYQIPNSDHVIPKEHQVIIPLVAFHYDERFWKNPEQFIPDRFETAEAENQKNCKFIPFGEFQVLIL